MKQAMWAACWIILGFLYTSAGVLFLQHPNRLLGTTGSGLCTGIAIILAVAAAVDGGRAIKAFWRARRARRARRF